MIGNALKTKTAGICNLLLLMVLSVVSFAPAAMAQGETSRPNRIVSLNLCTDQLLMMLVPKERIAAVSYFSHRAEISVMHETAKSLKITSGTAEDVILNQPDLVLAGTFTSRPTVDLLRRLGLSLVQVPPANSFDGIVDNIRTIGKAVGEVERAEAMVAKLRADLVPLKKKDRLGSPVAAPFYANSYSAGKQTLIDGVLSAAGFTSLGRKLGFSGTRQVSLETIITEAPDALLFGHHNFSGDAMAYEIFRHPALRHLEETTPSLSLSGALTICGTPHTVEAVRKLSDFAQMAGAPLRGDVQLVQRGDTGEKR